METLERFKSEKVRDLLSDFYEQNFRKAGVEESVGKQIVEIAWNNRLNFTKEIHNQLLKLFDDARRQAHTGIDEISLIDLFDLSNCKTFLDYGSNKFRSLNEVGYKYPSIEKLIATDVTPQQVKFAYPERSFYLQMNPDSAKLNLEDDSIDCVQIKYVLHHVKDEKQIRNILQEIHRVLNPTGKLLLWEESFQDNIDLDALILSSEKIGVHTNLDFMKRFNSFSDEEKWEFIIINDFLINLNNPHMQWTMEYRKWENWIELLKEEGFELQETFNLGLRLNAQIKQGVQMIGEFRLITNF